VDTADLASATWRGALDDPSISGIAVQIRWSDIEPAEGKPDWSRLDAVFGAAVRSKKWVHLLIFGGFFTPAWALEGVQTDSFPIQYGPGTGTVLPLPMPWDDVYLGRWLAFMKLVSARYGDSPAFRLIAADGPTSMSAEFTLPNSPADIAKWRSDGFTPTRYLAAWRRVLGAYAADFPKQHISLSVGTSLNIDDSGRIDAREHLQTRDALVGIAMEALGRRMALQLSDVHAGPGPHLPSSASEDQYIIGQIGQVVTGLQMRTSAEADSTVMGAPGDPPSALRRSIDLALLPNSAGRHVDYLEIYERDVLAGEMQPALQYAAALFK
jgi:hypothetical protein